MQHKQPLTFESSETFAKLLKYFIWKVKINQRVNDDQDDFDRDFESEEEEVKIKTTKSKRTKASGDSGIATTYTATKQFQPNPNFFNDIFNVRCCKSNKICVAAKELFSQISDSHFNSRCSEPIFE